MLDLGSIGLQEPDTDQALVGSALDPPPPGPEDNIDHHCDEAGHMVVRPRALPLAAVDRPG